MYNLLIGGAAGQGIDTTTTILRKTLKKSGYNIFTAEDVMSRVRGGHNYSTIRFDSEEVFSHSKKLDGIVALNEEAINLHKNELNEDGFILCDKSVENDDLRTIKIAMDEISTEIGNPKVIGTIAAGSVLSLFSESLDDAKEIVKEMFDERLLGMNMEAIIKGFQMVESRYPKLKGKGEPKLIVSGNEAISLGAIAAKIRFYTAYPMSPSTSIMGYLASKSEQVGVVVEQAEDEIAAINMAIGASYAGVRSMTGTSGGGFSLMVEALGLAGMAEIPIVIVDVQRPGPATGFPTRTEQSDLKFVISASHGEFPRMVISLCDHNDAFYQTARAFYMAEKYQIPVVILSDQYLADSHATIDTIDLEGLPEISKSPIGEDEEYLRYRFTEDGISPRLIPGETDNLVAIDSDEHNERGWITEDAGVRVKMTKKRMKKLEKLKEELIEPEFLGTNLFDTLLLGFGSTKGAIKETVENLNSIGEKKYAALVFGDVYPLPKKLLLEKVKNAKLIINIEQNATGQLADVIREQTGITCGYSILKYDGRQITSDEIVEKIEKEG
ncbi:MAG TPA: 2-oxoacid:acceptor oxidoreductase subunit alpha [Anaerovoracaceae bacterium]|nr:2-oxoacid:acceptor oxidoreductase subunit alpha [Anaerovoracaceae bacterium]